MENEPLPEHIALLEGMSPAEKDVFAIDLLALAQFIFRERKASAKSEPAAPFKMPPRGRHKRFGLN